MKVFLLLLMTCFSAMGVHLLCDLGLHLSGTASMIAGILTAVIVSACIARHKEKKGW